MKKISLLLILVMLLSLAACGSNTAAETNAPTTVPTAQAPTETTVPATTVPETTMPPVFLVSVPETVSVCGPDGVEIMTMSYVYEEGWADKETFTATINAEIPGQGVLEMVTTYGDKYIFNDTMGITQTETYYDELGRVIRQVSIPNQNPAVDKIETISTHDEYGRVLTTESKTYNAGQSEPTVSITTYTYTDTDTGSKGTCEDHGLVQEVTYDQNYRQVASIITANGQESTRTESAYDEYGNLIRQTQYVQGQKMLEYVYTYTIVEVGAETAARLPQLLVQE